MTYERRIRLTTTLTIDERISCDDHPSLPMQAAPVVDTDGETVSETVRPLPLAKCGAIDGTRARRRKTGT